MTLLTHPVQLDMFDIAPAEPVVAPASAKAPAKKAKADATPKVKAVKAVKSEAAAEPSQSASPKAPVAQPAKAQGRQMRRARVVTAKVTILSPEARQEAAERHERMIQEFLAKKSVTQCPTRWANGSVRMSMFGSEV